MRFREVFTCLLILSFISAFFLPATLTNPARNIQALFYPVARPARAIGSAMSERFAPPPKDDRNLVDIRTENDQLKQMVSQLTAELLELQKVNADRQLNGDLRRYCTPVRVVGSDAGRRESLALRSGSMDGIQPGQPVLSRKGLVGKVERSGPGGSQVQLVTDRGFSASAEFRRFERDAASTAHYKPTGSTPPLVNGAGDGMMTVVNVPWKETQAGDPNVEPVKVGDVAVLNDPEWENAGGQWLGHVEKIEPLKSAPLFAQITVRPVLNLAGLREVQVMNKVPGDAAARTAQSVADPRK